MEAAAKTRHGYLSKENKGDEPDGIFLTERDVALLRYARIQNWSKSSEMFDISFVL